MAGRGSSAPWGTVEPTEDRGQPSLLIREGGATAGGTTASYVWRPPADIGEELPTGFGLPFRIHTGADGLRRVAPVGTFESFTAGAWLGGFALLCRHRQLDVAQRQTYILM